MQRDKKKTSVENLREEFAKANSVFIIHYQGLTVNQMEKLRRTVSKSAKIFVSKNSLAKIALMGSNFEQLNSLFHGPVAVLFSIDPIDSCKTLIKYSESNDKLKILAGIIEKDKLNFEDIRSIAKLPSLDILRAQIIFILSKVSTDLANILKERSN